MAEFTQKKIGKLIGMKKSEFNELATNKRIFLRRPRLIPVYKLGDEMALTSVLLSSLKLIKEFRQAVFSEAKMLTGGAVYCYTEVEFDEYRGARIDGLILIVKSGVIRDAAIVEVKNKKSELEKDQIERYQQIAKAYSIPKFITISNQFVSDSTQSPINAKNIKSVDRHHFSWTYLLTIAHVLLFKKEPKIEDKDQIALMKEVVNYLEWDKSGVFGVTQMKAGWVDVVEKVVARAKLKASDENVNDAVLSWQQQERDMSLVLSRELGVLVSSGEAKYKGKLEVRLKDDCKFLVENEKLHSVLRIRGAVSDIRVSALFDNRTVEMMVSLKAPNDKTTKGQIGWIKRQLSVCSKRNDSLFDRLENNIYLEVLVRNSHISEKFSISEIDTASERLKGRVIREFRVVYVKDFGKQFSSPRKFVDIIEAMLKDYYRGVVQHLTKWEVAAPKMVSPCDQAEDDEDFDAYNGGSDVLALGANINSSKANTEPDSESVYLSEHSLQTDSVNEEKDD
ncbi:MAG: hypothetical protein OQK32_02670 [Gammaproteobacteria bacterium]|nr:hypothetical protein [Gammaproteobacteria bacterium]MCW8922756.1 hypothetical protein [Gammaproteobacteria bacterium]